MTGSLLLGFVVYFYLPHALFKIWAERSVDLGRKRDSSQVEEITSAILPTSFLHLQALIVIRLTTSLPWLSFPWVDWDLILGVGGATGLSRYLADFDHSIWAFCYVFILYALAFINGAIFGKGMLVGLCAEAPKDVFPDAAASVEPSEWYGRFKLQVAGGAFWVWKLLYHEYTVPIFPWAYLRPWVFVKTLDGHLFHGRFSGYDKTIDGQVESIRIEQVSRFSRQPVRQCLNSGENPIRQVDGVLYMKWDRIADINTTLPSTIGALWKSYELAAMNHRGKEYSSPLVLPSEPTPTLVIPPPGRDNA